MGELGLAALPGLILIGMEVESYSVACVDYGSKGTEEQTCGPS